MSIVVRDLVKTFGETRAVNGLAFEIASPGVVGLAGPNGAGKSTTLRMLTSYLTPTAGSIAVAGFDTVSQSREVRRRIGFLPETLAAPADVRVDEYLTFRAKLKEVPRRRRRAEIERCLQACGLDGLRRRIIGRMSYGQQRRVGLAEALLNDPPVLILDEPTAGLDPLQLRHIHNLLVELADSHTVLLSTHLLSEAETVCRRVLVIARGRLAGDIDLQRPEQSPQCYVEVAGDLSDIVIKFTAVEAVTDVQVTGHDRPWHQLQLQHRAETDVRPRIAELCYENRWALRELSGARRVLEARFFDAVLADERKAA